MAEQDIEHELAAPLDIQAGAEQQAEKAINAFRETTDAIASGLSAVVIAHAKGIIRPFVWQETHIDHDAYRKNLGEIRDLLGSIARKSYERGARDALRSVQEQSTASLED